jgi:hypothetical protein
MQLVPILIALSAAGGGSSASSAPASAATAFDPRVHGFDFVNTYAGDILVDVPLVGRVDLGDSPYGLCGGMSFAALDSFYAGVEVPNYAGGAEDAPPPAEFASGEPLRSFVYGRQMDSLRADDARLVRRLVTWIPRPIHSNWLVTGLAELTKRAFDDKIRPALDQGCPVPLCLVKADFDDMLPDPLNPTLPPAGFTKNHQVVAIGYRRHEVGPDHWDVDIYDPNYPDEVHTLHLKLRVQTARVQSDGSLYDDADDPDENRRGRFRGFFRTPYEAGDVPWAPPAGGSGLAGSRRGTLGQLGPADGDDEQTAVPSSADAQEWLADLEERVALLEERTQAAARSAAAVICLDVASDFRPIHATRSLPAGVRELSVAIEGGAAARFREIAAVFVAVDVGDAAPPGTEMARSVQPTAAGERVRFRYSQTSTMPPGAYRVDLLADGAPWLSLPFRVQAPGSAAAPGFPLQAGRRWQYDFLQLAGDGARLVEGDEGRGQRLEGEVELRVAGAGDPAHVEILRDGKLVSEEWWRWDERGLSATRRTVDGQQLELTPPQLVLSAVPGVSAWEYGDARLGFVQRCRQWGPLELSGPWGRAAGYVVRCEQAEGALVHTAEREFVPGLGLVRERIATARGGHLVSSEELVLRPAR